MMTRFLSFFIPATFHRILFDVLHRRSARVVPVMRRFMRNTRRRCSGRAFAASWYVIPGSTPRSFCPSQYLTCCLPRLVSDLIHTKTLTGAEYLRFHHRVYPEPFHHFLDHAATCAGREYKCRAAHEIMYSISSCLALTPLCPSCALVGARGGG